MVPMFYLMFGQSVQNIIGEIIRILIIGNQSVMLSGISRMELFIILQDSAHIGNQIALKSNTKILTLT